ncbi:SDR family oxidoreductase [Hymenobacter bucti]|uniref:SDR family oxidoreductase n=1 Tax=Hymenobacter bucti TaxID=1844114 RepID=A0ABW4QUQ1_9BACT
MNLTNQTVLITGATSGIGLNLAIELHKLGNQVIICGRRQERLAELAAQHPGLATRVCDVSEAAQRESLAAWATATYPSLNVLVNNAGFMQLHDLTQALDSEKITAEITTDLIAPIHLGSLLAVHLAQQPTAAIINVTSGLAFTPLASMPVYCAAKAGLHSFCLSLRYQLRDTAVRVFEIVPPAVHTEFSQVGGYDISNDNAMNVNDFVQEVLRVLAQDQYEVGIGIAEGLRQQKDALFGALNP